MRVILLALITLAAVGEDIGQGWVLREGTAALEPPGTLRVGAPGFGEHWATLEPPQEGGAEAPAHAVFRALVEVTPGTREAGLTCQLTQGADAGRGLYLTLDRVQGVRLRLGDKVLWQDKQVGWKPYTPYYLEVAVEPGKVQGRLVSCDGKTPVAQSGWTALEQAGASIKGAGIYVQDGAARVTSWQWKQP